MSYRHLDNIDDKIIAATIDVGSKNGANRLSTKEIAKACGVSEFVIYDHFKSKEKLVNIADRTVFDLSSDYAKNLSIKSNGDFSIFFNGMVDYFVAHPDFTAWSLNYGHIFPRSEVPEDEKEFSEHISKTAKNTMSNLAITSDASLQFIYCWIIRNIVSFAALLINKSLEDTTEIRQIGCECSYSGIASYLKK